MAYAAAMKGQKFSSYVKQTYGGGKRPSSPLTCFSCGMEGHMQKNCPKNDRHKGQVCVLDVGKENIGKMSANLSSGKMEPLLARKKKKKRQKTGRGAIS